MNSNSVKLLTTHFLFGLFSLAVFVSCDTKEPVNDKLSKDGAGSAAAEDMLIGLWHAEWYTTPEAFPVIEDPRLLTMKGQFTFNEQGKVKIVAFGFDGCIFMSDTMTNELYYQIIGDTISLKSEGDEFGLPYQIREISSEQIKLALMEDIALTLTR